MSDHAVHQGEVTGTGALTSLSEDFRRVVERIQTELNGVALHTVDAERLATVDAAEQTVDALALELQRGLGDRDAWRTALLDYESAWLAIVGSGRNRRN